MSDPPPDQPRRQLRAIELLKVKRIWLFPVILAAVFVALMTAIYIGSVIDPTGHLHGWP